MKSQMFSVSSFGLAKGKELVSEDFAAVKVIDDLCIGIVCDGVGSARAGGKAARRVVNYLMNNFKTRPRSWSIEKSLRHFINNINSILYREGIDEYERPEYVTTLSIVVIDANRLYGANVGDSPIYLYRNSHLQQISFDHVSDEPGMEHVLMQAIGLSESVDPYFFENNLEVGDILLLTSDGLQKVLENREVENRLKFGASTLIKTASKKVNDDLPDDTTAVVIEIKGESKHRKLKKIELPIPRTLKKDEIIDGYRLLKPLIQNDRTWLAEKKGVKYVLKFPPVEAIEDEQYLDLFVKEAWNASRLKAGFFPKAVIPKNRTQRYYVMEYLEGVTLKELIAKKALPVEDAIQLGKFLLHACSFLLKYDLVHGDIKPENIIVLKRHGKRVYKLIDFGSIVEVFSIATRAGTPSYLAPERFTGEPISEQTEIFAIGVTLYESLTKKFPYGEIEPFQTPTFKTPKPVRTYNKAVPAWLESVVMRAIERDKDRRYEVYSEMEYELTHPEKVKPYYPKDISLFEKEPIKVYRWLFIGSFLINILLLILLVR
ncbi:bifunctional protein-serine/threonine kinase/phosphatase [Hydrogenimonas thermophila]|uniref:Serine/threonine protein phosphatase PrpC n=1 Tax=Hydrogenimonas thermophila TaxID=223786 RepID=A0A1I5R856_9BACT|nr:bifunctional protein-serine/threonine kinase/phosphatase [Hydrogenimonas thermophila]SFP54714.1 Serine/threonine protein phosphatase PrpC [Hydrogenimonas thermophila]